MLQRIFLVQATFLCVSCLAMNGHLPLRHSDDVTCLLIHLSLLLGLNALGVLLGTGLMDVTTTCTHFSLMRVAGWEVPALLAGQIAGGFGGAALAAAIVSGEA